jgi:hypothetical protein
MGWLLLERDHQAIVDLNDADLRRIGRPKQRESGDRAAGPMRVNEHAEVEVTQIVGVDCDKHVLTGYDIPVGAQSSHTAQQCLLHHQVHAPLRTPLTWSHCKWLAIDAEPPFPHANTAASR